MYASFINRERLGRFLCFPVPRSIGFSDDNNQYISKGLMRIIYTLNWVTPTRRPQFQVVLNKTKDY